MYAANSASRCSSRRRTIFPARRQGVVDCFFVENGGVTVLDYKTDRLTAAEAPARAERYRGQLRAYARALGRILGLPVRRCALWFLRPGVEVDVEIS